MDRKTLAMFCIAPFLAPFLATAARTPRAAHVARADTPAALAVMNAASITLPIRAALDSFAAHGGPKYTLEPGASLEIARRVTELHQIPDVILLADPDVFPKLLMPRDTRWYTVFARNRMVLAYTPRSRGADKIDSANWRQVVTQPGVEVGRPNPNTDPSGYRTLFAMQLAERHYHEPGLYARLLAAAPERNVRPREADQVALLQTHELDYIWTYENLAENDGLKFVKLPDDVDLGEPADSATYATATARITGKRPGDTITVRGAPILFALSIPLHAANAALGERFVHYLLSPGGRGVLRSQHLDALDRPFTIGTGAPAAIARP